MRLKLQRNHPLDKDAEAIEDTSEILNTRSEEEDEDLVTPATGLPLDLILIQNISRVIYNKIGKTGGRSLLAIAEHISARNNFQRISSDYHRRSLNLDQEARFVSKVMSIPAPFLYDRHVKFVDFSKYDVAEPPGYINLIRDPLERKLSAYYYNHRSLNGSASFEECVIRVLEECRPGKLSLIPYFCGQSEMCSEGHLALETAKRNVVEKYIFVGLLEHFERSLRIWQHLMPQFFLSAPDVYHKHFKSEAIRRAASSYRRDTPEAVKEIMRSRMRLDYEFYDFVKKRMALIEAQLKLASKKRGKKKRSTT
ncbi:uronyl 2-sulfotransferase-like [Ptychodera flava]|uniref:uronyl 2-sulfotransferase-like n=1 Tax=Ptychodera flava TaxID=63121 RepID=UPI00396AAD1F